MNRQPRLEIFYCRQCRWLLRASWMAQEMLTTFGEELGEVAIVPGSGGIFEIALDGEVVATNRDKAPTPDASVVKRAIRDRVAPDKAIGRDGG